MAPTSSMSAPRRSGVRSGTSAGAHLRPDSELRGVRKDGVRSLEDIDDSLRTAQHVGEDVRRWNGSTFLGWSCYLAGSFRRMPAKMRFLSLMPLSSMSSGIRFTEPSSRSAIWLRDSFFLTM